MHTPKFPDHDYIFNIGGRASFLVPTEKRIRAFDKKGLIADSTNAMIIKVTGKPVNYCFPLEDVKLSSLARTGGGEDELGTYISYGMRDDDGVNSEFAKEYIETTGGPSKLRNMVLLDWKSVEKWMEEEETVSVHPRDPYTRIDVLESRRKVEVWMKGIRLAKTDRPRILFETGLPARYYIPPEDVRMEFLVPAKQETACPYKGRASYWDAVIEGETYSNVVWSYLEPFEESLRIKGYMCFYSEKLGSMTVDGKEI